MIENSTAMLYVPSTGKVVREKDVAPVLGGEYHLPGYGEAYDSCGIVKFEIICQSCGQKTLARNHCDRKECPTCYTSWATRRARVATDKLESGFRKMGGGYRPRHIIVSPPSSMWTMPYNDLLKKLLALLKRFSKGRVGGLYIGHPWRFIDDYGDSVQWKHCSLNKNAEYPIIPSYAVYRPHLHVVMFGWTVDSVEIFAKTGVVLHTITQEAETCGPLKEPEDVHRVVYYQLTHCGVDQSHHALRWFGNMSYNNFVKVGEAPETIYPVCSTCGGELWAFSLAGVALERYSLKITRYYYRFKEKQKLLVKKKRLPKRTKSVDRHKGDSASSKALTQTFLEMRRLEGKLK